MKSILIPCVLLVVVLSHGAPVRADTESKSNAAYSTVKLFFVNQWLAEPERNTAAGRPSSGGLGGGAISLQPFRIIKLFINDEFIGNAILRHVDVSPTLNLGSGRHKFRIECEGYETFEQTLTVLHHGSTQWLVIRLKPEGDE